MAEAQELERPQIYLLTPPEFELSTFPTDLARVLDSAEIACLRLTLATSDEDRILRAADVCREVAHARDVPIVISEHALMVERLGLDGVHLGDGARRVRKTRTDLGQDAIVGAYCTNSRHEGMNAGENGADYISFGPAGLSTLGDGTRAEAELFGWWSEMIEVPVVAEGALDADIIRALTPITDFFAIGEEIWRMEDPVTALKTLINAMDEGLTG
ncbi:thiamine phosphate synthase [Aliiroseovarius crassostreae]|uniref:thiamine phosphate synthase n=1 Tax=Aliiroseovarius crassostreae TaxID=154981 RepID=UPI00220C67D4|nr:thiamine phosphate synthase [Aliiroseovarius crassostreae]UWP99678.1 thiamine phosphate synthase [Aliiroseovarius crassostreae]